MEKDNFLKKREFNFIIVFLFFLKHKKIFKQQKYYLHKQKKMKQHQQKKILQKKILNNKKIKIKKNLKSN